MVHQLGPPINGCFEILANDNGAYKQVLIFQKIWVPCMHDYIG